MTARPKFNYIRSNKLLHACRYLACQNCGSRAGTCVAAHSNWAEHGKGRGIKASDQYIAALCLECHHALDQGKEMTEVERRAMWDRAHAKTVHEILALGMWPVDIPLPPINPEHLKG
jgi:hypothetical protein